MGEYLHELGIGKACLTKGDSEGRRDINYKKIHKYTYIKNFHIKKTTQKILKIITTVEEDNLQHVQPTKAEIPV